MSAAPQKFYFSVIIPVGIGVGLVSFGLFYAFFAADLYRDFSLSAALLYLIRSILTLLTFIGAVFWIRHKGGRADFMQILVHYILIGVTISLTEWLPNVAFNNANPNYLQDIHKIRRDRFIKEVESLPNEEARKNQMDIVEAEDKKMAELSKVPVSPVSILTNLLALNLLIAILFGLILGSLFHYIGRN